MTDAAPAQQLLVDFFDRIRELVVDLTDGLTGQSPPTGRTPSPTDRLAGLAPDPDPGRPRRPASPRPTRSGRVAGRFGLPFDDGHRLRPDADEVGQVRVGGELLAGYHADVDALTRRYLDRLDAAELARVVDTRWDPPVTAAVRLVSVIGDPSSTWARRPTSAAWPSAAPGWQ